MYFSGGILFSRFKRLKTFKFTTYVNFISSANQEPMFEEGKLLEGLETNLERSDTYEKNPRIAQRSTHFETISKYFDSKECLQGIKDKVPPHVLLKTFKCPHSLYFIDKDVASKHNFNYNSLSLHNILVLFPSYSFIHPA